MRRRLDWIKQLTAVVEHARDTPFAWGTHDCALFAANCVLAMTGVDFAAEFRGTYDSAEGARRALRGPLEPVLTARLGPPCPRGFAGRGDVVLVDPSKENTFGPAVGIVGLSGLSIYVVAEDGLGELPITRALKAWKI